MSEIGSTGQSGNPGTEDQNQDRRDVFGLRDNDDAQADAEPALVIASALAAVSLVALGLAVIPIA